MTRKKNADKEGVCYPKKHPYKYQGQIEGTSIKNDAPRNPIGGWPESTGKGYTAKSIVCIPVKRPSSQNCDGDVVK
jgi:hypothetical protein